MRMSIKFFLLTHKKWVKQRNYTKQKQKQLFFISRKWFWRPEVKLWGACLLLELKSQGKNSLSHACVGLGSAAAGSHAILIVNFMCVCIYTHFGDTADEICGSLSTHDSSSPPILSHTPHSLHKLCSLFASFQSWCLSQPGSIKQPINNSYFS